MGANASSQGATGVDLSETPEEVVIMILCHVAPRDIICNCSSVCRVWYRIINESTLWKIICARRNVTVVCNYPFDYKRVCIYNPFGRNLIKNGDASKKMDHWDIVSGRNTDFLVENGRCSGAEPFETISTAMSVRACWSTSFMWCVKKQTIKLSEEGLTTDVLDELKPDIVFEDWTAARFDCASVYTCEVMLLSEDGAVVDSFTETQPEVQWVGKQWRKITHTFRGYKPGVRQISVKHGGKDSQFWAGHFGPKITATSLCVNVTADVIHKWQQKQQHSS